MRNEKTFIQCLVIHKPEEGYRLSHHIHQACARAKTVDVLSSWEEAIHYLQDGDHVDLVFGSFELTDLHPFVFDRMDKRIPVVFTSTKPFVTEKAFSLNCIDFLNDDPSEERLAKVFTKFELLYQKSPATQNHPGNLEQESGSRTKKSRFLVKSGEQLFYKTPQDVAFFLADGGLTYLIDMKSGDRYLINQKLMDLEDRYLDPRQFFRINRGILLNIKAIASIKKHVNSRLKIIPKVSFDQDIIVSREKVRAFKKWMNQ